MKYGNKELLTDWQNNINKVAKLTKHSTVRTAKKSRLNDLLNTVSTGKIVGATEHRIDGKKMLSTHNCTSNTVPALIECLSSPTQLPAFLKAFYPEILQRKDYRQACQIVESNLKQLPTRRSKSSKKAKDLFVATNKSDPLRDTKKMLLDIWRAANYATINQFGGTPLVKGDGRGVYLTCDVVKSMLKYPQKATPAKIYNGLLLLRVGGFIQLAQDNELTPAAIKLETVIKRGVEIKKHNIFILNDFGKANPRLITDNLNLNLSFSVSRTVIEQILGCENAKSYFPSIKSGVDKSVVDKFKKAIKGKDLIPISTLSDTVNSIKSDLGISAQLARLYINQMCQYKPLHVVKLKKTDAMAQGYDLTGLKDIHSSEKLLVIAKE